MAQYKDIYGNITEVGNPELNPNLIAGKTLVSDTQPVSVVNPNFSGTTTGGEYANAKINSNTLTPTSSYDFATPSNYGVTAFPPTPELGKNEYALGPTEKGISQIIQGLTSDTLGADKEAYRIEQEKLAGLEALKKTENDYVQQYKQLEAEYKNIEPRITEGSIGVRGMKGIQTITESEQRKVLMQANTVSALLSAAQGNVSFAQSQVDRAVANKFAVREAERKTKLDNLELLSKDPALTIEQKKRAEDSARRLRQEEQIDEKKKTDTKTILDWAVKASAQGATPAQAQAIAEIGLSTNPDIQKAIGLYAPFSIPKGTPPAIVQEYEYAVKGGYEGSFTDYQNEDANRKKSITAAGIAGDNTIQTYADLLAQGKISLSNVPQNVRSAVITATGGVINKPLSDTAIKDIQQSESAVANLNALKQVVESNLQFVGPISGLARFNPWSKARQIQAEIDRVKQQVGKTLEGGVLRKEDEEKYKKILATLADTPETAIYKIDSLINSIQRDVQTYQNLQQETGRFVPNQTSSESLRAKYKY